MKRSDSGVFVEPATGLLAETTGVDHTAKQRRRSVVRLCEFRVQGLCRCEGNVETDGVEQRQWTHRVAAAALHGLVDVFCCGVAGFEHPDSLAQVRDEQSVDDEARTVARANRLLAQGVLA